MEKRISKRVAMGVVAMTFVIAVLLGVLKGEVISGDNHTKATEKMNAQGIQQGAAIFKNSGCTQCHAVNSNQKGFAPSLKGLFKGDKTLSNGVLVSERSVREQIEKPYRNMPSYSGRLNPKELDQLILYLRHL